MFIRGHIAWIADVVCVYALKGSKKKGNKLDEDFLVRLLSFLRGHPADIDLHAIPAGSQAHRSQGRAEGRVGDASDAKQEGLSQTVDAHQGVFLGTVRLPPLG